MLRKNIIKGVLALSAAAASFAIIGVQAQTPATDTGKPGATVTQPAPAGTGAPVKLARSDQKIIKDLAMANMAEVEAGRLAQTKSQNEQVKKFAQQMVDDHTKALDDVKQLAQARGVTLPTELGFLQKRQANKLATLSGEAFDRAYLDKAGVAEHKKTHDMLQRAQNRAKDPDVKALVARTLPVVDQHMTAVQELHKNTARGSSTTQGTTGSSDRKD